MVQETPVPTEPRYKRWTRRECEQLESMGLFEGQRYELVEGNLIDKMGMNPPHMFYLMLTVGWLISVFGVRRVLHQMPIDVRPEDNPTSEPQPDACVLAAPVDKASLHRPGPADIALVVEVADTTLAFDSGVKASLYARAGVADYWILDIPGRRVLVHRNPQAGVYESVAAYSEHERVAPLAAPESAVSFSQIAEDAA